MWMLSNKQLANISLAIEDTIERLKRDGWPALNVMTITLRSLPQCGEWWLYVETNDGGSTYKMMINQEQWVIL